MRWRSWRYIIAAMLPFNINRNRKHALRQMTAVQRRKIQIANPPTAGAKYHRNQSKQLP
jgi:hypothetical protein